MPRITQLPYSDLSDLYEKLVQIQNPAFRSPATRITKTATSVEFDGEAGHVSVKLDLTVTGLHADHIKVDQVFAKYDLVSPLT